MNENNNEGTVDVSNAESSTATDSRAITISTDRESSRPSVAVVEAVARASDCDPLELAPLYDSIDGDTLDALVASSANGVRDSIRVSFRYEGFDVTIGNAAGVNGDSAVRRSNESSE